MTPLRIRPGVRALALTTTAFIALASFAQDAQAATAAGTVIRNQATATYTDGSGNRYQAQSNVAEITVQKVFRATLAQDRSKTGAAGQTVYSSHTLSNLGNSEAYYRINVHDLQSTTSIIASGYKTDLRPLLDTRVYRDLNGNGVADAGEPVVASWSASGTATFHVIRVDAGQSAQLIIAAQLPTTALASHRFGAGLYVQPVSEAGVADAVGGSFGAVVDATPALERLDLSPSPADVGSGFGDHNIGMNNLRIDVTNNAVLEVTKEATLDVANKRIHYVTTVRNVGGRDAHNVRIFDAAPSGTTLIEPPPSPAPVPYPIESRGFTTGVNIGDVSAAPADLDEDTIGRDLNGDGLRGVVRGVEGLDAVIAPGTTVQMAFSVNYDPARFPVGSQISNTAYVQADLNGDGTPEPVQPSNQAIVHVGSALYGVSIDDTGPLAGGGDDDGAVNAVQQVASAPPGSTVIFRNVITNDGSTADRFNLTLPDGIGNFPPGTHIAFWNQGGAVLLLDTDGDGIPNTPSVPAGESYTIEVRVTLPQNVSGGGAYNFKVKATSSLDPTEDAEMTNRLLTIAQPGVDLVNTVPAAPWAAGDNDAYNRNAATPVVPTTVLPISPGQSATFNLALKNHGGSPDSFQFYAGGRWFDGQSEALQKLQPLENGWTVRFYNTDNTEITTTPTLPPNAVYNLRAVVTAPADPLQTTIDYLQDVRSNDPAGDGVNDPIGTVAQPNAYPIFFLTHSAISGAWDVKLDAAKIQATPKYALSANKEEQTILPGGFSRTSHTLKNTGNTTGEYALSVENPNPLWGATLWVDTNGDGQPDVNVVQLAAGAQVYARDPSGALVQVDYVAGGFRLPPGYELPIWMDVHAPSDAAQNDFNTPVLKSVATGRPNSEQSARVPYRVSQGVLRLSKTAAHDASCDNTPDTAFTEHASRVPPGECAIWQVVGANVGAQPIKEVHLTDAIPDFTRYVAGTTLFCSEDAGLNQASALCSFTPVPDAALNPSPSAAGTGNLGIKLDHSSLNVLAIEPGASFTVRFVTRVE